MRKRNQQGNEITHIFFRSIERKGLTAIQFKSSNRLGDSFAGKTDFDLLVPFDDFEEIKDIAKKMGFLQRFTNHPAHPTEISDFLFYESSTGKTHHFSLHTELVFGSKPVKQHVVPKTIWGALPTSKTPEGVQVFNPRDELTLLLMRIALRTRLLSVRSARWWLSARNRDYFPEQEMLNEARFLHMQLGVETLNIPESAWGNKKLLTYCEGLLNSIIEGPIWRLRFVFAQMRVRYELRLFKFMTASDFYEKRFKTALHPKSRTVRTTNPEGFVFAVVGIDGSGKSTLVKSLKKELGYKLTVREFYLGQNKRSFTNVCLGLCVGGLMRLRLYSLAHVFKRLKRVNLERLRAVESEKILRFSAKGGIAIVDRYPLREFRLSEIKMDSPILENKGLLGRLEQKYANKIPDYPSGLIVLLADSGTALGRKTARREVIRLKEKAIEDLKKDKFSVPHEFLDATASKEEIQQKAMEFIWGRLATDSTFRIEWRE